MEPETRPDNSTLTSDPERNPARASGWRHTAPHSPAQPRADRRRDSARSARARSRGQSRRSSKRRVPRAQPRARPRTKCVKSAESVTDLREAQRRVHVRPPSAARELRCVYESGCACAGLLLELRPRVCACVRARGAAAEL